MAQASECSHRTIGEWSALEAERDELKARLAALDPSARRSLADTVSDVSEEKTCRRCFYDGTPPRTAEHAMCEAEGGHQFSVAPRTQGEAACVRKGELQDGSRIEDGEVYPSGSSQGQAEPLKVTPEEVRAWVGVLQDEPSVGEADTREWVMRTGYQIEFPDGPSYATAAVEGPEQREPIRVVPASERDEWRAQALDMASEADRLAGEVERLRERLRIMAREVNERLEWIARDRREADKVLLGVSTTRSVLIREIALADLAPASDENNLTTEKGPDA